MTGIETRRDQVKMKIHIGMLEALGVNMYTSVGQGLVEFVANGHDADASKVDVIVPFDKIESARKVIRDKAKEDGRNMREGIYDPLPDDLTITIADNGHGMTVDEVEDKFLALSRNRRKEESDKSESGNRKVMGRKGLGKLAGFGVAEQVIVCTKRAGETFATTIVMDFNSISACESMGEVAFKPTYEDGIDIAEKGTTITLKRLRCDSIRSKSNTLENVLRRNFSQLGDAFSVTLNGNILEELPVDYEFIYPNESEREDNGFGEFTVKVDDDFDYPIHALVKFRARGESKDGVQRGNIPAKERGARVYCNGRLAAGPTLFDLPTGMHNFHSQSYMECIVQADVLDEMEADLISTNRQGLRTDNEIVDAFIREVTDVMKKAIAAHGKFRDHAAIEEIKNDPASQTILASVKALDKKVQKPAKLILETIAAREGVDSEIYRSVAPHLVQAINSSEVLVELIRSGTSPKDLKTIIGQLSELGDIERSDVLKLYRGRRSGILGLQKLEERSLEKGPKYEKDFHKLLKDNPWLVKPEYGSYLTSDETMGEVARKLNKKLGIDDCGDEKNNTRPDLVFLTLDLSAPNLVSVVELKSPNVDLEIEHLNQLEGYIGDVVEHLKQDYPDKGINVVGHLIGNFARPDSQSTGAKRLKYRISEQGPNSKWEVITLPQLLDRARISHLDVIQAIEAEDETEDS